MIIRQKGFSLRPAAGSRALQLIDLLDEHAIHGLMYVDNAMVYERPTGHVVRTSNWALSCLKRSVGLYRVSSLRQAARDVEAIWKFALTDEDTTKLNTFAKHVEETLGLECEWSRTIRWILPAKATAKASV